jgi:hypothetical protein
MSDATGRPTIGESRLHLFVHVLVFDMSAVMFGSFIGLTYPSFAMHLRDHLFEISPRRRTSDVRGTGESRRKPYLQRGGGRNACISPGTNSPKLT